GVADLPDQPNDPRPATGAGHEPRPACPAIWQDRRRRGVGADDRAEGAPGYARGGRKTHLGSGDPAPGQGWPADRQAGQRQSREVRSTDRASESTAPWATSNRDRHSDVDGSVVLVVTVP